MNNNKVVRVDMDILSPMIVELIDNNSDVKITVTGNSMYPLFRHGIDCVLLTSSTKVKKYDIPLYRRENGAYILHRIMKVKDDILYICGDNQTDIEYPVFPHQVLAKVKGFYRGDKYISCDNIYYKLYSFLWVLVLPHRRFVIVSLKRLQSILRKLKLI